MPVSNVSVKSAKSFTSSYIFDVIVAEEMKRRKERKSKRETKWENYYYYYLFIYLFKVDKLVKILQNYYIKIAISTCGMLIKVNYLS